MAIERTVLTPVLDRLIDLEPGRADAPVTFAESVRQYKAAVRRDIEWLLNSRRVHVHVRESLEQVRKSVFYYGLPDVSSLSEDTASDRRRLLASIEEAIRLFEPRMAGVRVSAVEAESASHKREIRFLIEGTLRMDPTPEQVAFDTVLEVSRGEYEIRGNRDSHA